MDARTLYDEGCRHLSNALGNTQYTKVHSSDIMDSIVNEYFMPAAQGGYPLAIYEMVKYSLSKSEKSEAISWMRNYKEVTKCSKTELLLKIGWQFVFHL